MDDNLKKFYQMCNGNAERKVVLLTSVEMIKEERERDVVYESEKRRIKKQSVFVKMENAGLFAKMYFANQKEYEEVEEEVIEGVIRNVKESPDLEWYIEEVGKALRKMGVGMESFGSEKSIQGTPKNKRR